MSRPMGSFPGGYHGLKTFKPHVPIVYPWALLTADGKDLTVGKYPAGPNTTTFVRIPDNVKVAVGDWYNRRTNTFQKDNPNA